ncbi:hypothetical protein [Aureliella helgolandensis]|uniref:Uncharacterized protein n=1 Tax=Aureliella helgolandensis TaxID=2527968 RepID=A0A518GH92_9BACT|nr:hypothetical protein [Aureliella helgolandensis]QDV27959.1 hypothetical protein Q31a_63520 [Aureliella helgolandensis]
MIPAILTLLSVGLLIAGVRSLVLLQRIDEPTDSERSDPFYTPVTLLFSTAPRSAKFGAVQRRTIWLFCGSILVLYLARAAFMQSSGN